MSETKRIKKNDKRRHLRERRHFVRAGERTRSEQNSSLFVQSVSRAFSVMEAFHLASGPLSLSEIAEAAGINRSAAQRFCHTLIALGYLERSPQGNGLVPGRRILERSFDYLRLNPLIERAMPILLELGKGTDERLNFSLFDDLSLLYVIRLQRKPETFWSALTGRRVPTFCTAGGRGVMANLTDAQVSDILDRSDRTPLTPYTITEKDAIFEKVEEARSAGFAFSVQETMIGEVVVAASVLNSMGEPVAAVHVGGSLSRWSVQDFIRRFSPLTIEAATAIAAN